MWKRTIAIAVCILASIIHFSRLHAYDGIVEKKTFPLKNYVTVGGETIKDVKIGWESYGSLNADRSNAILITHYFSGTSHTAGKYKADDTGPGYWDAIVGPGRPLDTNKYFILSSDTLVNLNAKDENVITTGPYTIKNPSTHERYGMSFPIVTIRDFVNVQKALVESLGIRRLYAVMGASMGAMQAYEWASSYPAMVGKVIAVVGAGETDGNRLASYVGSCGEPCRLGGGGRLALKASTRSLEASLRRRDDRACAHRAEARSPLIRVDHRPGLLECLWCAG